MSASEAKRYWGRSLSYWSHKTLESNMSEASIMRSVISIEGRVLESPYAIVDARRCVLVLRACPDTGQCAGFCLMLDRCACA
jgi:hypothetical protein